MTKPKRVTPLTDARQQEEVERTLWPTIGTRCPPEKILFVDRAVIELTSRLRQSGEIQPNERITRAQFILDAVLEKAEREMAQAA